MSEVFLTNLRKGAQCKVFKKGFYLTGMTIEQWNIIYNIMHIERDIIESNITYVLYVIIQNR